MNERHVDVLVIGAGPAGTTAALRAASLGAKTALVTRGAFGGMAASDGPIPVRTLAHAARLMREARQLQTYGIGAGTPRIDYPRLLARAGDVVRQAREHTTLLTQVREAGILLVEQAGTARFVDQHAVACESGATFAAQTIILCVGGVSRRLDVPGAELTVTPSAAFGLTTVPKSLIIIGAGATGAQVASIFCAFGTSIALYEAGDRIVPTEDYEVSAAVAAAFREDGIVIREGFGRIQRFEPCPIGVRMIVDRDGKCEHAEAQFAVCAIGWTADAAPLRLDVAGVKTNDRGFVAVDECCRTNIEHVFAAGDVTGRMMLVPQAVEDGHTAASAALGAATVRWEKGDPIGSFTDPEYAHVGVSEAEARRAGDPIVARATYAETTRPTIDGRIRGFCKLVIERSGLKLIGCHIVGERAVEIAQMAAIAIASKMTVRELASIPYSYPTYTNVFGRALLRAVHELETGRVR